jgi:hypothetical protein
MSPSFFPPVPAPPKAPDALALLADEHDTLRRALERVDAGDGAAAPSHGDLVDLCLALKIHGVLERELVYPAARSALAHDAMLDRAQSDQEKVEQMIESLLALAPSDALVRDRVHALHRAVDRQFDEAEIALFSRLIVGDLDLDGLGLRLAARRREVLAELGLQAGR